MQQLIPSILNANTSSIQKKKDAREFSANRKTNTESVPQWLLAAYTENHTSEWQILEL